MTFLKPIVTAWTVWKFASKRVGPAAGVLVTAAVVGLVYLGFG